MGHSDREACRGTLKYLTVILSLGYLYHSCFFIFLVVVAFSIRLERREAGLFSSLLHGIVPQP